MVEPIIEERVFSVWICSRCKREFDYDEKELAERCCKEIDEFDMAEKEKESDLYEREEGSQEV